MGKKVTKFKLAAENQTLKVANEGLRRHVDDLGKRFASERDADKRYRVRTAQTIARQSELIDALGREVSLRPLAAAGGYAECIAGAGPVASL